MGLVTFMQGASYEDVRIEEARALKARIGILEYLTSGISWAVLEKEDSAQVEIVGEAKIDPENLDEITSTQVEGAVGDGNLKKKESYRIYQDRKEADREKMLSSQKKTKTKRICGKKQCEECKEMIGTGAFFNHTRGHIARRLCREAGENVRSHTSYYYYEKARILLNCEKKEKNSKKD